VNCGRGKGGSGGEEEKWGLEVKAKTDNDGMVVKKM
jgi:hypothetical protein